MNYSTVFNSLLNCDEWFLQNPIMMSISGICNENHLIPREIVAEIFTISSRMGFLSPKLSSQITFKKLFLSLLREWNSMKIGLKKKIGSTASNFFLAIINYLALGIAKSSNN